MGMLSGVSFSKPLGKTNLGLGSVNEQAKNIAGKGGAINTFANMAMNRTGVSKASPSVARAVNDITSVPSNVYYNPFAAGKASGKIIANVLGRNTTLGKIATGLGDPTGAAKTNIESVKEGIQNAGGAISDAWKNIYAQIGGGKIEDIGGVGGVGGLGGGTGAGGVGGSGDYAGIYTNQSDLGKLLLDRVQGNVPSQAVMASQGAQDRNLAQMAALSAAAPRSALTQRNLQSEQALSGQNIARDLGIARLNEQQQAQAGYSNLLGQMGTQTNQRDIASMQDATNRAMAEYEAKVRTMEARAALNKAMAAGMFNTLAPALGSGVGSMVSSGGSAAGGSAAGGAGGASAVGGSGVGLVGRTGRG